MQPSIIITCDHYVEFEEDATPFTQGEPEFVNGAAPDETTESISADSAPIDLTSYPEPEA
jgi:hypothetical protein